MVFETYKLDFLSSMKVFMENKDLIKINKCYDNIFDITIENHQSVIGFNIGLCYYRIGDIPFLRHLVFIKNNKIIDPTLFTHIRNISYLTNTEYIVVKELSIKEYLDICFNQKTTDIRGSIEEKSFFDNVKKHKINIFDIDYLKFVDRGETF